MFTLIEILHKCLELTEIELAKILYVRAKADRIHHNLIDTTTKMMARFKTVLHEIPKGEGGIRTATCPECQSAINLVAIGGQKFCCMNRSTDFEQEGSKYQQTLGSDVINGPCHLSFNVSEHAQTRSTLAAHFKHLVYLIVDATCEFGEDEIRLNLFTCLTLWDFSILDKMLELARQKGDPRGAHFHLRPESKIVRVKYNPYEGRTGHFTVSLAD